MAAMLADSPGRDDGGEGKSTALVRPAGQDRQPSLSILRIA
jgi:hypothetical protein